MFVFGNDVLQRVTWNVSHTMWRLDQFLHSEEYLEDAQACRLRRANSVLDAEIDREQMARHSPIHSEHYGIAGKTHDVCKECSDLLNGSECGEEEFSSDGSELIDMGFDWKQFLGRTED